MSEDYLWDRSGKPDRELQELEELLGTLRYQPQTLHIPHDFKAGRRRVLLPTMAIAAALALLALLLGLWLRVHQARPTPTREAKQETTQTTTEVARNSQPMTEQTPLASETQHDSLSKRNTVAANKTRRRIYDRAPELTAEEQAEKEQVLTALRLVSAKLNLAQRKTQAVPPNNIRNQHKVG